MPIGGFLLLTRMTVHWLLQPSKSEIVTAADFDYGADDDYINDLFEGHDMSMSDAADAEM